VPSATICLIVTCAFLAWEADRLEPKPYPMGHGDTLMVRIAGYSFCPPNCAVDHFHIGHFKNYNCGEEICTHITISRK